MATGNERENRPPDTGESDRKQRERDRAAAPVSPPVEQENPGGKGINPDQKGPTQPREK